MLQSYSTASTRTSRFARQSTTAGLNWKLNWNWKAIWHEIVRLIKYGMVGLSNTVVSMAVLNLVFLVWSPSSSAAIVVASTLAYLAGDLNSYWWNKSWTFGARGTWKQFVRFGIVSVVCMGINAGVVWSSSSLMLGMLLPSWLLGNASQISMSIMGTLGYVVCRNWVFRRTRS